MKERVLILNGNDFNSGFGGQATFIRNLHPYLDKEFVLKYLILPDIFLRQRIIPLRLLYFHHVLFYLIKNSCKYNLIVSHTPEASFIATLFKNPLVHIFHGNNNAMTTSVYWYGKYFKWVFNFFNKRIVGKAVKLYTVGESRKEAEKIFNPIIIPEKLKTKPEKIKDLVFAGRLEKGKNIDKIIQVYNLLPIKYKTDHILHIIGTGTQEKQLKRLVTILKLNDKVIFHGQITNDKTIEILNQSSILLMSSSHEGLPMVIAESLCVGTPVISTNVGDIGSVIKNGYNGYLVPAGYAASIYIAGIIEILSNYKEFSRNAYNSSVIFNAKEIAIGFIDICKSIMHTK